VCALRKLGVRCDCGRTTGCTATHQTPGGGAADAVELCPEGGVVNSAPAHRERGGGEGEVARGGACPTVLRHSGKAPTEAKEAGVAQRQNQRALRAFLRTGNCTRQPQSRRLSGTPLPLVLPWRETHHRGHSRENEACDPEERQNPNLSFVQNPHKSWFTNPEGTVCTLCSLAL